jgi:hypothetical protein
MSKKSKTAHSSKARSVNKRFVKPAYWNKNISLNNARQAVIQSKEKKRAMLNREAVGQVLGYCAMIAANDILELGTDGVEHLSVEVGHEAERFAALRARTNARDAYRALNRKSERLLTQSYAIKAGEKPDDAMSSKTWREVYAERRDAADMVVRFYACALDAMGYSVDQINSVIAGTMDNYSQFLSWAEDGEEVAYEKLRRCVEQTLRMPAYVERVGNPKPVFAKEF